MALSERYLMEPPATPSERLRYAASLLRDEMRDALDEGDPTIPVTVPPHVDPSERASLWRAITVMLAEQPDSMRQMLALVLPIRDASDIPGWLAYEYASWCSRSYETLGAFDD